MTFPVYLDTSLDRAQCGDLLTLAGEEGHHAAAVRRSRPGETIDVVNGRGLRARCEVRAVGKHVLDLAVREISQESADFPHITLVQALAKGGRDEQAVESSTEYGVATVVPWESERCIASWRGKEEKGRARWEATARAAAKQSRRSWLPIVEDVVSTKALVNKIRAVREAGGLVFVCHEEASTILADVLRGSFDAPSQVWIVVGPEGGITPSEVTALDAAGAQTVLLAPHVLRSASAGPYAIAVIAALCGSSSTSVPID